jgi:hypothetical protein
MSKKTNIVPEGFDITAHSVFRHIEPIITVVQIIPISGYNDNDTRKRKAECDDDNNDDNNNLKRDENLTDICADVNVNTTCAICLENYCKPLTLLCKHSYCQDCILQFFKTGNIVCPICKGECCYYVQSNTKQDKLKLWKIYHPTNDNTIHIPVDLSNDQFKEMIKVHINLFHCT